MTFLTLQHLIRFILLSITGFLDRRAFYLLVTLLSISSCGPVVQKPLNNNQNSRLTPNNAIMPDGAMLPIIYWPSKKKTRAVLIALHGFNDHSGAYDSLAHILSKEGIAVYAYDQRGFGDAPGRGIWAGHEAMAKDFLQVTSLVSAKHRGLPIFAMGESMGGAVIMVAIDQTKKHGIETPVKGAILSAPAVWGRSTMSTWQSLVLSVFSHLLPMIRLEAQGLGITPSDNVPMLRALNQDSRYIQKTRIDAIYGLTNLMDNALASAANQYIPLLVLYGEKDEIVPKLPTCLMLSKLPTINSSRNWRIVLYPDGYHLLFRDLNADLVVNDIKVWILNSNNTLPSGHEHNPRNNSDPQKTNPLPSFC